MLTGDEVGPYRLTTLLGSGGLGQVWAAEQEILLEGGGIAIEEVAIKIPQMTNGTHASVAYLRATISDEYHLGRRLWHPNLVHIHDAQYEYQDRPCLVMDCQPGRSLAHLFPGLRKANGATTNRSMSPVVICEVLSQVAWGLHWIHTRQHVNEAGQRVSLEAVHGDVKPANILMRPDGTVLLCDYGVSRFTGQAYKIPEGNTRGTPAYMSPEQANGFKMGPQSDLFCLGTVLYELLTEQAAFTGRRYIAQHYGARCHPNMLDLLMEISQLSHKPLATQAQELCPPLGGILRRCWQRTPEHRHPSAAHLARSLTAIGRYLNGPYGPSPRAQLIAWLKT